MTVKILFGVSSVGLGHARRSAAIANLLSSSRNDLEIQWVSAEPVVSFLESLNSGHVILPISKQLRSLSSNMERRVKSGRLHDMSRVAMDSASDAKYNYFLLNQYLTDYDILIQDEFAETMFCFMWDKHAKLPLKRVVITDYVRFQVNTWNPVSRIATWYANRMLVEAFANSDLRIFADDLDAVPVNLRSRLTQEMGFKVVGPVGLSNTKPESSKQLKEKLASGDKKMIIVVSVGGTSIGRQLIDLVCANSMQISSRLQCLLVVLLGPRIKRSEFSPKGLDDVQFVEFTANVLDYFAAADCVVSQAGASSLNEIAEAGKPCVVVPIANHFEQEANARRFSEKYGFVVLEYADLSSDSFVLAVTRAMGRQYEPQDHSEGAKQVADLILQLITSRTTSVP